MTSAHRRNVCTYAVQYALRCADPLRAAPVDRPRLMANAVVACMVVRLGLAHHLETRTPLNTGALLATKWLSGGVRLNYCGKRARRSLI